jgi:hypothetical protein
MENFELLDEYVFRDRTARSYSINQDDLTDPTALAH